MRRFLSSTLWLLPALSSPAWGNVQTVDVRSESGSRPPSALSAAGRDASLEVAIALGREAIRPRGGRELDFDDGVADALWARGRTYKASVDAGGFQYIPFFGSDAPRNFPVRFALASVSRGEHVLELPDKAAFARDGSRWTLRRGAVEVRYDLTADAVEQSIALDVLPGTGDLVLHFDVESELACSPAGGGFEFAGEHGAVTYGSAVAIDAEGHRAAVPAYWTGSALELHVPERFAASAVGPIVVDPIIQTLTVDAFQADLLSPSAAYDVDRDAYYCVYVETFSGGDADIYSSTVDATTGAPSSAGYVDMTSTSHYNPSVAFQRNDAVQLIVTEQHEGGTVHIGARIRHADTGSFDAPYILHAGTTFYECVQPDVAGDTYAGSASYFYVVHRRRYATDSDVYGLSVDATGAWVGAPNGLALSVQHDYTSLHISSSTGDPASSAARFNVTWTSLDIPANQYSVEACQLAYNGAVVTAPFTVADLGFSLAFDTYVSSVSDLSDPASGDHYYLVAWNDWTTSVEDLELALCAGGQVLETGELNLLEQVDGSTLARNLRVECLGEDFVCAYHDPSGVWITTLRPLVNGLAIDERRLQATATPVAHFDIALCTTFDGGAPSGGGAFVAWSEFDGADDDIHAGLFEPHALDPPVGVPSCAPEPNITGERGFLQAYGSGVGNQRHRFVLEGLPERHLCTLYGSDSYGPVPGLSFGGSTLCLGGILRRVRVFEAAVGGVTVIDARPNAEQGFSSVSIAPGETWYFQAWYRQFGYPGQSAGTNLTNAIGVTFL